MHFYFTLQSTVMWCCQSNGSWCPKTQQGLEKHAAAAFQCNAPQNRSEKSVEYLHSGGSAGGVWVQKISQIYMILKLLMYIMNDVSMFLLPWTTLCVFYICRLKYLFDKCLIRLNTDIILDYNQDLLIMYAKNLS